MNIRKPTYGGKQEQTLHLNELGYSSLADYKKSELGKRVEKKILEEKPNCKYCGEPSSKIKREYYSRQNLVGENTYGIYTLCTSCGSQKKKVKCKRCNELFTPDSPRHNICQVCFGHHKSKKRKNKRKKNGG